MKDNIMSLSKSIASAALLGTLCSITGLLTTNAGATGCVQPPSGLIGWWRAEGDCSDESGGNRGTMQNGATFATGRVGQAFCFDGVDDYVKIPWATNLNPGAQVTVEFWMKADATNTMKSVQGLVATDFYGVSIGGGGSLAYGVDAIISTDSGTSWATTAEVNGGGAVVSSNQWHHVAATYDGTQLQLYIDGQTAGNPIQHTGTISPMTTNSFLSIGSETGRKYCSSCLGSRYFKGLIDEPTIYNRALSAAEIAAIFNTGVTGKCVTLTTPFILVQPTNQMVVAGANVTLGVTAGGTSPFSYQWRYNGTNMAAGTSASLTLTNVQLGQSGIYSVVVSNAVGSVTSSNAVLTVTTPPCANPPSSLISWWAAEGNANDVSGANNGALQNGTTLASGVVGQAFSFDGTNDTVNVPDSSSLQLTNLLTIEAWIKVRQTNIDQAILSKVGGSGGNNGYQFVISGNKLVGQFNSPSQSWPSAKITSSGLIATGTWYHVAWTYDQSAMKLYLNGLPVATNAVGAKTIATSSSPLRVSGDGNDHVFFSGLIDEPSVYNRALSAAEIAAIYTAGSLGKCGLAPTLQTSLQSQIVECSSNANFSATATGLPPLAYQWFSGSSPIAGATNSLLALTNVGFAQAGLYYVIITNVFGSTTGGPVTLTVVDTLPPAITTCATSRTLSATSDCAAVLPDMTGELVASDASGPVVTEQTPPAGTLLGLGMTKVIFTARDSSSNSCSCSCTLTVADLTPPHILTCTDTLTLGFDTNCQALLPDLTSTNYITASDNCSLAIVTQAPPALTAMSIGTNTVELTVSDAAGNQTNRTINVILPGTPHILLSPADLAVNAGSIATFNVIACGGAPLTYQWRYAGTNLPRANGTSLVLTNVQWASAGGFDLLVSNSFGVLTSRVATLSINGPVILAKDGRCGMHTNQFGFDVGCMPGKAVIIEASTNLVRWEAIQTNLVTGSGLFTLIDHDTGNFPRRFYRPRLYVDPLPLPVINPVALRFRTNGFGFSLYGVAGQTVVVQASTDLTNWTSLATNVLGTDPLSFHDAVSSGFRQRFYRTVLMP